MQNLAGIVVLLAGIVSVIVGFILGQMGYSIPGNVLGLYSPITAVCVFGGAVVAFIGFVLMMTSSTPKSR